MASLGPEEDDGDVVGASGVVGGVDQGGAGGGAVGLGGEDLGDAGVGDRFGEAVGAEEDLVAGVEVDGVGGVDGDAGVEADGAGCADWSRPGCFSGATAGSGSFFGISSGVTMSILPRSSRRSTLPSPNSIKAEKSERRSCATNG